METEIIDKLFLELSQVSTAITKREMVLLDVIRDIIKNECTEERCNWFKKGVCINRDKCKHLERATLVWESITGCTL